MEGGARALAEETVAPIRVDSSGVDVRRSLLVRITRATTINDFAKLGTALGGRPTIVERLPRIEVGPEAVPRPLAFCQGPCACISCPHLHSCPRLRKCTVSCGLAGASPKTTGLAVLCKKLC